MSFPPTKAGTLPVEMTIERMSSRRPTAAGADCARGTRIDFELRHKCYGGGGGKSRDARRQENFSGRRAVAFCCERIARRRAADAQLQSRLEIHQSRPDRRGAAGIR